MQEVQELGQTRGSVLVKTSQHKKGFLSKMTQIKSTLFNKFSKPEKTISEDEYL